MKEVNKSVISGDERSRDQEISPKVLHVSEHKEGIDFNAVLVRLSQYMNIGDTLVHVKKEMKYVVQIPLKDQKAFEDGKLFLNENSKTGILWPTLYKINDKGKREFVDNLPIKAEETIQGNPFTAVANGYYNICMQGNINELAEKIDRISKKVERIEIGQKDDRIGELRAGKDQILLSIKFDPERRNQEVAIGRGHLLSAQKKIFQTLKSRVENFERIPEKTFELYWKVWRDQNYLRDRDAEFHDIQEYYGLYLEATTMLAASYAVSGDYEEAEKVFEIAEDDMSQIDFSSLRTIDSIHTNTMTLFYNKAVEYVEAEKEHFMNEAKQYDCIDIEIDGNKLLEVFGNDRKEEISEPNFKQ